MAVDSRNTSGSDVAEVFPMARLHQSIFVHSIRHVRLHLRYYLIMSVGFEFSRFIFFARPYRMCFDIALLLDGTVEANKQIAPVVR